MVREGLTPRVESDRVSGAWGRGWASPPVAGRGGMASGALPARAALARPLSAHSLPLSLPHPLSISPQVVKFHFTNVGKLPPPVLQFSDVTFGYSPDKARLGMPMPCHAVHAVHAAPLLMLWHPAPALLTCAAPL